MKIINIVNALDFHSKIIWEWRNDPITRKMSINNKKISWEEHSVWFKKKLLDKNSKVYIGEEEGVAFGFLRFDNCEYKKLTYKVSINLCPSFRGRGLGKTLLSGGIKKLIADEKNCKFILASVKKDNVKSIKLFESLDFKIKKFNLEINNYELSIK